MLGIEPIILVLIGKHYTVNHAPSPLPFFQTGFHEYHHQVGVKLATYLRMMNSWSSFPYFPNAKITGTSHCVCFLLCIFEVEKTCSLFEGLIDT